MLNDHLNEVRWKVENVFTDDSIFGVTDHKPIFENSTKTHCIGLYLDANTGTVGSLRLIKKVLSLDKSTSRSTTSTSCISLWQNRHC